MSARTRIWLSALGAALLTVSSAAAQQKVPEGYPDSYAEVVANAVKEGKVTVYSNMPSVTWVPIIAGFKRLYPSINVETLDIDDEMFERYLAEKSTGVPTADLLVTPGIAKWIEFSKRAEINDYQSPEAKALPAWARPLPGLFIISLDPYMIAYNKTLIPADRYPKSMDDVAALVKDFPNIKVVTYDPLRVTNGHAVLSAWIREKGDRGWKLLESIGPSIRTETAGALMMQKLLVGEYAIAFFTAAGASVRAVLNAPGADKISAVSYIGDGTPMMPRAAGITKGAPHPNAAKLLMDYIVSRQGQVAMGQSLTPMRADIEVSEVPKGNYTYGEIVRNVGEKNIVRVEFDPKIYGEYDQFLARWRTILRGGK